MASIAGLAAPVGWAPLAWWPVALLCHAVLFLAVSRCRAIGQAALVGGAFGLALHLSGHGWIYDCLNTKTGMGLLPALVGTTAFVSYLALFTALPCAAWRALALAGRSIRSAWVSVPAFAALLTLGEYSRSLLFNGFTSMSLGYALIDTWLAGLAPVFGVYGLSWIGFALAAGAVLALESPLRWRLVFGTALAFVFGIGAVITQVEWVRPNGAPLSVRLIQGNVAQAKKFDPLHTRQQIALYAQTITAQPADIIVTPETAFPVFLNELPGELLEDLQRFSRASGSHLLLGIATRAASAEGHNSVAHVAPGREDLEQYDKVRLMAFGEYSPTGFGWFTGRLHIGLKDLEAGRADQRPFQIGEQRIGTLICQEDVTSVQARRWLANEPAATLLVNPSNLAWFEGSAAPEQSQQLARMRALEVGRPLLRVANTGVTSVVDHRGQVLSFLPAGAADTLRGHVQGMQGLTPYARRGDLPLLLICALSVVGLAVTHRRHSRVLATLTPTEH